MFDIKLWWCVSILFFGRGWCKIVRTFDNCSFIIVITVFLDLRCFGKLVHAKRFKLLTHLHSILNSDARIINRRNCVYSKFEPVCTRYTMNDICLVLTFFSKRDKHDLIRTSLTKHNLCRSDWLIIGQFTRLLRINGVNANHMTRKVPNKAFVK